MALVVKRRYPCCDPSTFHPLPSLKASSIGNGSIRALDHETLGITGNILLLTSENGSKRILRKREIKQRMVMNTSKGQVELSEGLVNGPIPLLTIQQITETISPARLSYIMTTNRIKSLQEVLPFRKERLVQF